MAFTRRLVVNCNQDICIKIKTDPKTADILLLLERICMVPGTTSVQRNEPGNAKQEYTRIYRRSGGEEGHFLVCLHMLRK